MSQNLNATEHLPAVAPDIVLVRWGHGEWQVRSLSDRLAEWIGVDPSQVRSRPPATLFPDAVPSITSLAGDVLDQGQDLADAKLRLLPNQPEFLADVQFAGLTEDYLGQLVRMPIPLVGQPHHDQHVICPAFNFVPAQPEVFRAEYHIIVDRLSDNLHVNILKHHAHPLTGQYRIVLHIHAINGYGSPGGRKQPVQVPEKSSFTGSVGPGHHHKLTPFHRHVYLCQGLGAIGETIA